MRIKARDLIPVRNEYSLISYGPRCFAILWGASLDLNKVEQFLYSINAYNPHRIHLCVLQIYDEHTKEPFVIVEMKYKKQIHQKYFTYLMWLFSHLSSVWIHIWDTLEHDALRRDFSAPAYMDSELSINRLWLKEKDVYLLKAGYSVHNPHGEYVIELALQAAMDILEAGKEVKSETLLKQLYAWFSGPGNLHIIKNVLDVSHVYIPKSLANLVLRNPSWIEHPDFEVFDPTHIVLDALPSSIDLTDEVAYTVAVSDKEQSDKETFTDDLTTAQWVSLSIKVNANKAFHDAIKDTKMTGHLLLLLGKDIPNESFSSSALMKNLKTLDLSSSEILAKRVECPDFQLKLDCNKPVNVLSKEKAKIYEELQRANWGTEEDEDNQRIRDNIDINLLTDTNVSDPKAFFTGLEDTYDFSQDYSKSKLLRKFFTAIEDPHASEGAEALAEEDLRQTADLDDFDDFVEYYATQFLGYDEKDLEKHRVGDSAYNFKSGGTSEASSFDWNTYNNDSDYKSLYTSEEDVGM